MKRFAGVLALTVCGAVCSGPATAKPPQWDTVKKVARFKVLKPFNSEAVLDKETGLVWTISPGLQSSCSASVQWTTALYCCESTTAGNRAGWRLPSLSEMQTLIDPSAAGLPAGHPFTGVPGNFWTTTTSNNGSTALVVNLPYFLTAAAKTMNKGYWCVRAPGGLDVGN